jgi:hypothetical protein
MCDDVDHLLLQRPGWLRLGSKPRLFRQRSSNCIERFKMMAEKSRIYREPYGGRWVILAALPIELVEPTPFQRNLSDTHVRKLALVIRKGGRFLDPIIVVRAPTGARVENTRRPMATIGFRR